MILLLILLVQVPGVDFQPCKLRPWLREGSCAGWSPCLGALIQQPVWVLWPVLRPCWRGRFQLATLWVRALGHSAQPLSLKKQSAQDSARPSRSSAPSPIPQQGPGPTESNPGWLPQWTRWCWALVAGEHWRLCTDSCSLKQLQASSAPFQLLSHYFKGQ